MVDVPLRIVPTWDPRQLDQGIRNINTKLGGIQNQFRGLFNGLITGAAIAGVIRYGQSIDDLNDSLSVLKDVSARYGANAEQLARSLVKATDGDLSFRQSVTLTAQTLQRLGKLGVDNIGEIGVMAQKMAVLMGGDVAGAVDALTRALATGNLRAIKAVAPALKDMKDAGKDTAETFKVLQKALADINPPGGDPFTRLRNSLQNLSDSFGKALFDPQGKFSSGVEALAASLNRLADWISKNEDKVRRLSESVLGFTVVIVGLNQVLNLTNGLLTITAAIQGTKLVQSFISSRSAATLLQKSVDKMVMGWMSYADTALKAERMSSELGAAVEVTSVSAARGVGVVGTFTLAVKALVPWLVTLAPLLLAVAAAWALIAQHARQAAYDQEISSRKIIWLPSADYDPNNPTAVTGRWATPQEVASLNAATGTAHDVIGMLGARLKPPPIPPGRGLDTTAGAAGTALSKAQQFVADRLKEWGEIISNQNLSYRAASFELRHGLTSEIEYRQSFADGLKGEIDAIIQRKILYGLTDAEETRLKNELVRYNSALADLGTATAELAEAQRKMSIQIKKITDTGFEPFGAPVKENPTAIGTLLAPILDKDGKIIGYKQSDYGAAIDKLNAASRAEGRGNVPLPFGSFTPNITGGSDKAPKVGYAADMHKILVEFNKKFADILAGFLKNWMWEGGKLSWNKGGKGLAQSVVGAAEPALGNWAATALGMGSDMFGPMGQLVGGVIGFGLNRIFGQDKPMKIEQPVDMRLVDIVPRLTNFFNWRGVNVYSNRYYGVIESGLT